MGCDGSLVRGFFSEARLKYDPVSVIFFDIKLIMAILPERSRVTREFCNGRCSRRGNALAGFCTRPIASEGTARVRLRLSVPVRVRRISGRSVYSIPKPRKMSRNAR